MSKIITVFGATGTQGGSVVDAVLKHAKQYKIRGVTRDTTKPAAQALAAKGVELVKADMNHQESIQEAIRGSYAVFAVTNYWEHGSAEIEIKQGKNVADAAVKEHVHHLIWSSLPNVTKMTGGKLTNVAHFDSKANVEEYIRSLPKSDLPVSSFFLPAFYMANIQKMSFPGPDGNLVFAQPWTDQTRIALLDTKHDTGNYVAGILLAPESEVNGVSFQGTSAWVSPQELVNTISEVTGKKISFKETTQEQTVQAMGGGKAAEELAENMVLVRDYKYFGNDSEAETPKSQKILVEKPSTWAEFVKQTWH